MEAVSVVVIVADGADDVIALLRGTGAGRHSCKVGKCAGHTVRSTGRLNQAVSRFQRHVFVSQDGRPHQRHG
jgi:hypothetical protein